MDGSNLEGLNQNVIKTYNSQTGDLVSTKDESEKLFFNNINTFFQKEDGTFMDTVNEPSQEDMEYFFDEESFSYLIRVGASIYFVYYVEWPITDKYSQDGVYYEAKATAQIPFVQYNE